jgi:hypothetical protein
MGEAGAYHVWKIMDPEILRLVNDAAAISLSGRWAAVNERIVTLAAHPGIDNAWWVQLFGALCSHVFSEYQILKNAYENRQRGDVPLLAWRARNLLELSVWSAYCAQNRQNARRVFEDAGRDAAGLFDAFMKWGTATAQSVDWSNRLASAKQDLSVRALHSEGIDSLDEAYKQVSDAAKECGLGDHFKLGFKFLSKFSHPTAMRLLAPPDERREDMQREMFFGYGCLFFTGAFDALEGQLRT